MGDIVNLPDHAMRLLGEQLRAWRENAGLSQNQLAKDMLVDRSLIPHVEAGRKSLTRDNASRADDILGTAGALTRLRGYLETQAASVITPQQHDDLATVLARLDTTLQNWQTNHTMTETHNGQGLPGWPSYPTLTDTLTHVTEKTPIDRRDFTVHTSSAILHNPSSLNDQLPLPTTGQRIGKEEITAIREHTTLLRKLADQIGSADLLATTNTTTKHALWLFKNSTYTEATGLKLAEAITEKLLFCGWLAFDSLRHAAAQTYWTAAIRVARVAHNPQLEAIAFGWLADQAGWLDKPRDAVDLIEAATEKGKTSPQRDRALLALWAARVHAIAGDHHNHGADIKTAFASFNKASEDQNEYAYWLNGAQMAGMQGESWLAGGNASAATQELTQGINALDAYPRDQAEYLIGLSTAYAQLRDLEHAHHAVRHAEHLLSKQVHSPRLAGLIRDLTTATQTT